MARTQGLTEYVVVVGLVALLLVTAVGRFGDAVREAFGALGRQMSRPMTARLEAGEPGAAARSADGEMASATPASRRGAAGGDAAPPAEDRRGKVKLAWDPPTSYVDGSPLNTLAGYRIYYGTEPGSYGAPVEIGPVSEFELTGLESGRRYYFAISTRDAAGNESALSNEVSKVVP